MDFATIRAVFKEAGVPLSQDDIWKVQQATVVKHKALERLAAKFKIKWDKPDIIRADTCEAVILVGARRPDKDDMYEWSIGECKFVGAGGPGGNYKINDRQPSYPWAMAEKRAKDRVILKLAGLHGAYSEDEADDFKEALKNGTAVFDTEGGDEKAEAKPEAKPATRTAAQKPRQEPRQEAVEDEKPAAQARDTGGAPAAASIDANGSLPTTPDELKARIDATGTINAVTDLMLAPEVQTLINAQEPAVMNELRDHAKNRLVALGWPTRKTGRSRAAAE